MYDFTLKKKDTLLVEHNFVVRNRFGLGVVTCDRSTTGINGRHVKHKLQKMNFQNGSCTTYL